ncbi:DUF6671 family protein [Undibacterium sp. Dicai25W]|uniref:DUF6671 family protein n=1 Tax=Undibacterium sp. Dicai25W TaxID=3413034 RepID=UPI003BEF82FA
MSNLYPTALLTCHGKQVALEEPLAQAGYAVFTVSDFNTDSLGTFTGEIAREGTMLEAARRKAQLACSLSGARFGIGSEGSFGGDPWFGITGWGREVLVWYDAKEQLEISAFVQGPETNYANKCVSDLEEALTFAAAIGFPQHGIVVGQPDGIIYDKSCSDMQALSICVIKALEYGAVDLATDMRAHRNPKRMQMIARCAQDLATRLATHCPQCQAPGFGAHAPVLGALCEECHMPTQQARAVVFKCVACGFESEKQLRTAVTANYCDYCNP